MRTYSDKAVWMKTEEQVFLCLTILCYGGSLLLSLSIDYSGYFLVFFSNLLIFQLILRSLKSDEDIRYIYNFGLIANFGYAFLSLAGMLLILHHKIYYNQIFDIWGDDDFFYTRAVNFSEDWLLPSSFSEYERILGVIMTFQKMILNIENHPVNVLNINWFVGGLVLAYAGRLAYTVAEERCRYEWLVLSVLGNYGFTQNVAHLYRDVFVSLFTLLIMIWSYQGKIGKSIFVVVLTAFLRVTNASLNFCFLLINTLGIKANIGAKVKAAFLAIILALFIFISFISPNNTTLLLGNYAPTEIHEQLLINRIPSFQQAIMEQKGGTSIATQLPLPLRILAMPILQLFVPIRVEPWDNPDGRYYFTRGVSLNHMSVGFSITVLLWIIVAPRILQGIYICYKKDSKTRSFFLCLLLIIYYCGFISFQPRHRTVLIILFPTLMALSTKFSQYRFISTQVLTLIICSLLLLANILIF